MLAVREALANYTSRLFLTASLVGLIAALLLTIAYTEFSDAQEARAKGDELLATGYTTLLVTPSEQLRPRLTGSDCVAVDEAAGVIAATWAQPAEPVRMWTSTGPELPVVAVGTGVLEILGHVDPSLRDWSGEQTFVDRTSALVGSRSDSFAARVLSVDGTAEPVNLFPADLRVLGQGVTAQLVEMRAAPPGSVGSCMILGSLADRSTLRAAVETAFPASEGYGIQWALPNADRFEDPVAAYRERDGRLAWLAGGTSGLVIVAFYLRLRRPDHAFYAVAGLGDRGLRLLILVELAGLIIGATMVGGAVLTAVYVSVRPPASLFEIGLQAAARFILATALAAFCLAWYAASTTSQRAVSALKDR